MKTVTLLSNISTGTKLEDRYSMTIGLKGNNHDVTEYMFVKELLDMLCGVSNVFYSDYPQRYMRVHFELLTLLCDQA